MLREKYTNASQTTLNGAINNSVTSVTVTDGSTFPTGAFRVRCDNEIMYVTSRSTNVLTVVRGYEGTTAVSHTDGSNVDHVITKSVLDRYRLGILADIGLVPYDDSLSADDDEFDDESFTGWTQVQGTPNITVTEKHHRISILFPGGSASAQFSCMGKTKTPSAGDWIQMGFNVADTGGQFPMPGLFFANGSTYNNSSHRMVHLGWSPHESNFVIREVTGFNTHVSQSGYGTIVNPVFGPNIHMRFKWAGSNSYTGQVSTDGISWATLFTALSYGSVGTPTFMGMGWSTWGAARDMMFSASYCRFSF